MDASWTGIGDISWINRLGDLSPKRRDLSDIS
jgi:hypothetical protein